MDYAGIERETSEKYRKSERETHRVILQALDIDVPTVVIGGIRYNRVGRCEAPYHTLAGSVSIERSLYRQAGHKEQLRSRARLAIPVFRYKTQQTLSATSLVLSLA